jgi:hypothetical protein
VTLLQKQHLQLAPRQARLLALDTKHTVIIMQPGGAAVQSASIEAASRDSTAPPRSSNLDDTDADPEPTGQSTEDDGTPAQASADEQQEQQKKHNVAVTLTRLVVLLACMSHRDLTASGQPSDLPSLLGWLAQQCHSQQLQHSIARWIGWAAGSAEPSKKMTTETAAELAAAAWQELCSCAEELPASNPEFASYLQVLAVQIRQQLSQAIGSDEAADRKSGIVQAVNGILQLCGDELMCSTTPQPLVDNMLDKLLKAAPHIFKRPAEQQPAVEQA